MVVAPDCFRLTGGVNRTHGESSMTGPMHSIPRSTLSRHLHNNRPVFIVSRSLFTEPCRVLQIFLAGWSMIFNSAVKQRVAEVDEGSLPVALLIEFVVNFEGSKLCASFAPGNVVIPVARVVGPDHRSRDEVAIWRLSGDLEISRLGENVLLVFASVQMPNTFADDARTVTGKVVVNCDTFVERADPIRVDQACVE